MKFSTWFCLIVFFICNTHIAFSQAPNSVFFDSGKSDLKPESESALKSLAQTILSYPDVDLRIEAFTDDKGSETFNKELAQHRAETVRNYLLSYQIIPQNLDVRPIGELPVDAKQADIEESRRKNRRVDVYFTPITIGEMKDLSARLSNKGFVTKEIQPDQAATINGVKGVKVEIPENAFVTADGQPCKKSIQVTVKEALKPDDWILSNLSTVSTNGQIMSSGGMFNIEATSDGKPVKLKMGKQAKVTVPSVNQAATDMKLFYGTSHDSTLKQPIGWQDGQIEWEKANIGNSEKQILIAKLQKRYKICQTKDDDFVIKSLGLDAAKLAIAFGDKPRAPYLDEPIAPKIKTIENTPVKQSLFFKKRELTKRDKLIAQSEASYPKRLEAYKKNIENNKIEWAKYHKDSVEYEEDAAYAVQARSEVYANEKKMIRAMAIHNFNTSLPFIPFYETTSPISKHIYDGYSAYDFDIRSLRNERALVKLPYKSDESFLDNMTEYNKANNAYYWGLIDSLVKLCDIAAIRTQNHNEYNKWLEERTTLNVNSLNEYVGDVVKLGWVNIDKFYKYDAEKANLVVLQETEEARVYLVCKEINSILPMNRSKDKTLYGFGKVPSELSYALVAIKLKDGFPYISVQTIKATKPEKIIPDYKKVTVPQLKEVLAGL